MRRAENLTTLRSRSWPAWSVGLWDDAARVKLPMRPLARSSDRGPELDPQMQPAGTSFEKGACSPVLEPLGQPAGVVHGVA